MCRLWHRTRVPGRVTALFISTSHGKYGQGAASRGAAERYGLCQGVYAYSRLTPGLPYPRLTAHPPLITPLGVAGRHLGPQAISRRSQGDTERSTVPTELCLADCGAAQQAGGRGRVRRAVPTLSPYRTRTTSAPPRLWRSTSPELILQPITIHRSEIEYTTIEPAVNSARRPRPPTHPPAHRCRVRPTRALPAMTAALSPLCAVRRSVGLA